MGELELYPISHQAPSHLQGVVMMVAYPGQVRAHSPCSRAPKGNLASGSSTTLCVPLSLDCLRSYEPGAFVTAMVTILAVNYTSNVVKLVVRTTLHALLP
jgi:hypothetical protein